MQINDIIKVNIEGFSNLGYGIARVGGMVIFVEGACPDDVAEVKITKVKKNFANAVVVNIITPSSHRTEPFCKMQKVCGACQMQHIEYEYQLELKRQIVQDTVKTLGGIDITVENPIPAPNTRAYRHKIQYPVSQTKVSKRLLAGYFKPSSHEIVNIKHCPIQPKICDEIIEYIREKSNLSGYDEKTHTGELRHIVIRVSAKNKTILVTLVINSDKVPENVKTFAENLYAKFDDITGVCVNLNNKKTNVILSNKTVCLAGKEYIEDEILGKTFKIGANTFFQVNPESAENIFKYVRDYIKENYNQPVVLDAYAGISAFGIVVSDVCKEVVCVEENPQSCDLAQQCVSDNCIKNLEVNCMDAAKFFEKEKRKFDVVIIDPPRKGCTQDSLNALLKLCKKTVIYVSCNPATLARDLKYLIEKGAKVKSIQPVDMFCHTYHIENIAIIDL